MNISEIFEIIKKTGSPLKKQLLIVALITKLLEEKGKDAPIVIGGCALSYYSREVYFTADIDLSYSDIGALDTVLNDIGFKKQGRYWINEEFKMAVEVPISMLIGEDSPVEIVEITDELKCRIIGIEDLIIDRLNACKYWKSEIDCEMTELLIKRYGDEIDWDYLKKKAELPENKTLSEILELRRRVEQ